MKNVLLIIFGLFSLFLAIYYYLQFDNTQQQLQLANQRVLDRDTEIYKLQKQLGIFRKDPNSPQKKPAAAAATLGQVSAAEINRLKKQGLKDPVADLTKDLQARQQQLLPRQGTLGGTMAIRDVQLLNGRYALAYFEDGHQAGQMVLRYEVRPGGRISWTVLDSYQL